MNKEEISRLKEHLEKNQKKKNPSDWTEFMPAWLNLNTENKIDLITDANDIQFNIELNPNEIHADLFIYMIDDGRGLFTDIRKMEFSEAFAKILEYTQVIRGFNYIRRIPVVSGKTQPEHHLTPNSPEDE